MNNIKHNKPDNRTDKRKIGDIGENVACLFLEKHGFKIVERNYLRKWGEIDIVARKGGRLHFVEVKSVSSETYRPEENMHQAKLHRLYRTIETYLLHRKPNPPAGKYEVEWQLDLITARIDLDTRQARVELIENIV